MADLYKKPKFSPIEQRQHYVMEYDADDVELEVDVDGTCEVDDHQIGYPHRADIHYGAEDDRRRGEAKLRNALNKDFSALGDGHS